MNAVALRRACSFSVLRYCHDLVSGEFVNVGIVIFSPHERRFDFKIRCKSARISAFFNSAKGDAIRKQLRAIESGLKRLNPQNGILDLEDSDLISIVKKVLPVDDSALQWSTPQQILSRSMEKTLADLFERFVMKHDDEGRTKSKKSEQEIWAKFKKSLPDSKLLYAFENKTISGRDDEIEFEHAWKNGIWHCIEPVSFDLSSPATIKEKAHKWLGQITSISDTREEFKLYLLTAKPSDQTLNEAYEKAVKVLSKMPIQTEVIEEENFINFGRKLEKAIQHHSQNALH